MTHLVDKGVVALYIAQYYLELSGDRIIKLTGKNVETKFCRITQFSLKFSVP